MIDERLEPDYEIENPFEKDIDHMREWFEDIIDMSYGIKKFDAEYFEKCLEEVGSKLNLNVYKHDLTIGVKNV